MARYESKIKTINALQENVYRRLSNLSELQTLKDNMPPELKEQVKAKLQEQSGGKVTLGNFSFDEDHARFTVNGMPTCISIVEREEPKCVKYAAENSPVACTLWIQMLPEAAYTTKIRVTIDIDIPFYLRPMVGSKLDGAADMIAEALTRIPY